MKLWLHIAGEERRVEFDAGAARDGGRGDSVFTVDGCEIHANFQILDTGELSLIVDGRQFHCRIDGDAVVVKGQPFPFRIGDPRSLAVQAGANVGTDGPRLLKASMPGRVVRVLAAVGDVVEEGQGLIVIEAMKMQNELKSPKQGRVARITSVIGATVAAGDTLAIVE